MNNEEINQEVKEFFKSFIEEIGKNNKKLIGFKHYVFVIKNQVDGDITIEHSVGYKEIPSEDDLKSLYKELLTDFNIDLKDETYNMIQFNDLF